MSFITMLLVNVHRELILCGWIIFLTATVPELNVNFTDISDFFKLIKQNMKTLTFGGRWVRYRQFLSSSQI